PLVFPVQDVHTTAGSSRITLDNPGTAPLVISSIAIQGNQAAEFAQTNTCTTPISPGSSCSIDVTFTPGAVGPRSAQLVVTDTDRRSPHVMDLKGEGANSTAPQVLLSPTSIDFKNQATGTTSAATAVLLTNPGGSSLAISSIALSGTNQSEFAQTNNCAASL